MNYQELSSSSSDEDGPLLAHLYMDSQQEVGHLPFALPHLAGDNHHGVFQVSQVNL